MTDREGTANAMTTALTQNKTWRLSEAPDALPLIGHGRQLRSDPLGFVESLRDLGDIVLVKFGPAPVHMVTRYDYAHHILVERSKEFVRGGPFFEKTRTIMGDGLATSLGPEHLRQRRLTQTAFNHASIARYAVAMQEESEALVRTWQPGQEVDIQQAVHDLTTRVTLRCFFSSDTSGKGAAQIINDAAEALDEVGRGMFKQMTAPIAAMSKLPTRANRRYRDAVRRFNGAVNYIIAQQRDAPRSDDLIGLLMAAHDDETNSSFTDVELRDQVVTFLGAGIDTTANLMAWSLGLLAENPATRAAFFAEVDAHGGPNDPIDVKAMRYTAEVLNEALRLYPPLWSMMRVTKTPVRLGGHDFPAGTTFGVSPYALQRDPRVFDNPTAFDPSRRDRLPDLPRSTVIPFGGGTHKCIGDGFAMTEATIALTTIARHWQLDLTPASSPLRPATRMTLGPADLTMRITPRHRD